MLCDVEIGLFDQVADALLGMVPPELGTLRTSAHRYGVKVWFGTDKPTRVHYEAQVIGARHVPEASVLALELGLHAEHPKPPANEAVIAHLLGCEAQWRRELGPEAVVGPFIGRADLWQRVSEVWADPDLSDPDIGLDVATRLVDYISTLEPLLPDP